MTAISSPSPPPNSYAVFDLSHFVVPQLCPCKSFIHNHPSKPISFFKRRRRKKLVYTNFSTPIRELGFHPCFVSCNGENPSGNLEFLSPSSSAARNILLKQIASELESENGIAEQQSSSSSTSPTTSIQMGSNFTGFQEDPMLDKLRTQLGVIHPIPSPPINRNIFGLFVFFFFVGVAFDKLWTSRKMRKMGTGQGKRGPWPQVPTSFSLFLEKDLQRKESVEWVNMVLGKLWKVYRGGLENWVIGLLQPVIDNLQKPDYVERVEIKQFSLGDEPLSVRNVERRTSRRANDLQYQIGLRYTGGARALLMLSLKFGIIPIVVPVGIRDFDIDGELWVKVRLIPAEPWVGAVSWAFVSLPKIKFELSPFRLFNLMAIPVLSMFLTKLLTEDLPQLFVRPKKIVLDFQSGKAVGPVANDFKSGEVQEGNSDFVGELSVTLVDARKLSYFFFGKTDPYVVLSLGDQTIRSKKNSQTTVIGPPGEPIWNQDFHMLVANPRKQKLQIQVKDGFGLKDLTIGSGEFAIKAHLPLELTRVPITPLNLEKVHQFAPSMTCVDFSPEREKLQVLKVKPARNRYAVFKGKTGAFFHVQGGYWNFCEFWPQEVDIGSLQDTVPTDRIVVLQGGWGLFRKGSSGEILLRLTYKSYVEDEEDDKAATSSIDTDASDDELSDSEETNPDFASRAQDAIDSSDKESFIDVLAALIVSEEFQGIVASETGSNKVSNDVSAALNAESAPPDSNSSSEGSGGSVLAWLAVATSILVLIAVNMGGSGFFNP